MTRRSLIDTSNKYLWSSLLAAGDGVTVDQDQWHAMMERIADRSLTKYRELVEKARLCGVLSSRDTHF